MIPLLAALLVQIPGGSYRPVFPAAPEEAEIAVAPFRIDERPVTNAEFLAFVQERPAWERGRATALYVDEGYLSHWAGPTDLGAAGPQQPVTRVSWFAARAYCEARDLRLPTEAEWELVAAASADRPDGRGDPAFHAQILQWYGRPGSAPLPDAGAGPPNWYGVRDLHGVVWEWVDDFNASLVTSDNRDGGGADGTLFCGAAGSAAADKDDYAAFMRIAFRSALQARYSTGTLGFRCAGDPR